MFVTVLAIASESSANSGIGDFVWHDLNADGIQDVGEPGIDGVTVNLYHCAVPDNIIATTTTDSDGKYIFTDPLVGFYDSYIVEFILPDGYAFTQQNTGADDAIDSDADPITGKTHCTDPLWPWPVSSRYDLTLDAGLVVQPQEPCGECDGGVTSLTLKYLGSGEANIVVKEGGKSANIIFVGVVAGGDTFSFDGAKKDGKIGNEIKIFVNGVENTKIHTSCSRPIGPGLVSGKFEVIKGYSLRGGRICPLGEPPAGGAGDCDSGKPQVLTMQYTGEDCGASSHSQEARKVSCSGDPGSASTVYIIACDKKNIEDERIKIWFAGYVNLNETFDIDAMNEGESKLKAETVVFIFAHENLEDLLQSVRFHTSCSQPLNVDDQFGSLLLTEFIAE